MTHFPPIITPAHGCVPDVVVIGGCVVVVVVVGGCVVVVVVVGGGSVVVVVVGGGSPAWVEGTHSPNTGAKKKRRRVFTIRAAKHTRSIVGAPTDAPSGTHNTAGSRIRIDRSPTVTGNGGMNRAEFPDG